MPDSITAQLINAAWDDIQKAVPSGLTAAGPYGMLRPTLDTVAVVSTEKLSTDQTWHHLQIPDAPPHVRVE